ncbi:MAG TPA: O-antigen ligase family protein [Solirubrobacteraceae bacterium]|nr:O-antigen ligase family protein [Solirubrobacteraceae bacterium]
MRAARAERLAALPVAGVLCAIALLAKGGLSLGPMTALEIALTIGSGVLIAGAILLTPAGRPLHGRRPLGLLLALSALTAISLVWSVQPDASWQDADRMFAYSALFALALVLARAAPSLWAGVLGGVVLAALVVCVYALLTRVFPDRLDARDIYARLHAPYDYWNAIGLTAAMGVIGCLWLGARRAGHAVLSALSYPAMGLMLVTLMLAYSRGALVALILGVALWLCVVPLRLRGATLLLVSGAGAAIVVAWDFSKPALSSDGVALAARTSAGHELGALILAMVLLLLLLGLTIGFATGRHAPSRATRRRLGAALLCIPVIALLVLAGLLAHSRRGLTGSVSHAVSALTDPNAAVPPNTPGRLTAIGSVRARYWKEALQIFDDHPLLGAGAGTYGVARKRYRTETLDVEQAHGFLVQTLSDLGLLGLALVLALLVSWLIAAGRSTRPFNRLWERRGRRLRRRRARVPYSPERIGLLSMLCLVVVFGAHSTIDWTWYVPGDAAVALLCAGWLAGRGPLPEMLAGAPGGDPSPEDTLVLRPGGSAGAAQTRTPSRARLPGLPEPGTARVATALAVLLASLLAAWSEWHPQRSVEASDEALAVLARDPRAALDAAGLAVRRDPLSAQALFALAAIQQDTGQSALARETLQRAVRLQPSNPRTWQTLGEYDLLAGDPHDALGELRAAVFLNPEAVAPESVIAQDPVLLELRDAYLRALRANEEAG